MIVVQHGLQHPQISEADDLAEILLGLQCAVYTQGGTLATLCIGNIVVAEAGLLRGKRATTYPHSEGDNFAPLRAAGAILDDAPVVVDDRIISCRGPGQAIEVALLLLDDIIGPEASAEIGKYIVAG